MRIPIFCMSCQVEYDEPRLEYMLVEVEDVGRYTSTCSHGHVQTSCVQELKFEVLYEIGANAIIDGYYREAVSSFSSALERFYEFVINLVCVHSGLDEKRFSTYWKSVSNQSERQLGAYVFLWGTTIRSDVPQLTNKEVSFRNEVVHKGKIPKREEAIEYGERIYSLISGAFAEIRGSILDASIDVVVANHVRTTCKDTDGRIAYMSIPTILSLSVEPTEHYAKSFKEHLARIEKSRKAFSESLTAVM